MHFPLVVYLILGHYYEHLGLLLSLEKRGLLDQGEYFVVGIDIEQYDTSDPEKYLRGLLQDEKDVKSEKAFRSYMAIVPSAPVAFNDFAIKVNLSSSKMINYAGNSLPMDPSLR